MIDKNQQPTLNLEEFNQKSVKFYNEIKPKLESEALGKFAALDYETSQYWIGETASETLTKAKQKYPNKVFYLIQVGSPSTFNIQSIRFNQDLRRDNYGLSWSNR